MRLDELLATLRRAPLIASVQASPGSPLSDPRHLRALAQASLSQGVAVLRLQGVEAIETIVEATSVAAIGLIKREYPDSPVYITPTLREVEELLATPAQIVALDATGRPRPSGASFCDLARRVHECGRLVMADCDTLDAAIQAEAHGADLIGTTLAGYTEATADAPPGPAFETLRAIVRAVRAPVLAEGHFAEAWEVQSALRIGAAGVVVGGALNDPVKQTLALLRGARVLAHSVGAVDIGGTWIRFATFSRDWQLLTSERAPLPQRRDERIDWIRARAAGLERLGVSTGGCVDPASGVVWRAKPIIPDHEGSEFSERTLGRPVVALNDGLATAWAHACHPAFASRRVATLALGTGVGFGLVDRGRLLCGPRGEPQHLNDQPTAEGATYEDLLGGASLGGSPSEEARNAAQAALDAAVHAIRGLFHPEALVLCGGVGLADWLRVGGAERSPFGLDAGLYGAGALALFPPIDLI